MKELLMLRSRNFRMLFYVTALGTMSEVIFGLASIITVSKETGSVFSIGFLIVLMSLPAMVLSPVQGALIDRFDKVRLSVSSTITRVAGSLILASAIWADLFSLTVLYGFILAYYVLWYFLIPVTESMLKEVLMQGESLAGMSLMQSALQVSVLVSAPLAGFMVERFGLAVTLVFAAGIDMLGAFSYARIRLDPVSSEVEQQVSSDASIATYFRRHLSDIRAGWSYTRSDRRLMFMVIVAACALPFFQAVNTLLVPFAYRQLKGDGFSAGLVDAGAALGSLLSAMLLLRFMRTNPGGRVLFASELLLIFSLVMFSMTTSVLMAFVAYIAVGMWAGNMKVLAKAVVLERMHKEFSGRVMSAVSLLGLGLGAILCLGAGLIADINIFYAYGFVAAFLLIPTSATFFWLAADRAGSGVLIEAPPAGQLYGSKDNVC